MTAIAQDVQLRSLDGSVTLEGNLMAFDGAYYRLDSIYGPLTIAAEGVQCAGPGCPDLERFVAEARIAGEATVVEGLLPALLAGFAESRGMVLATPEITDNGLSYALIRADGSPAARFDIAAGTSDTGMLALLNGEADLAISLREASEAERRADRAAAPDDPALIRRVRVIGLEALVPVVAAQNPINAISLPQLAQVFTGEIDNWQALGGPDAPIALHLLDADLGLAQVFETRILPPGISTLGTEALTRHASARDLASAVARDAYAIGITAQSARGPAQSLPLAGSCGFSQAADANAVKAEDYPLTAPVYLYLAPRRLPQLVRDFLIWTESEAAERTVAAAGFVNQSLTRTPMALQGSRIANAITAAGDEVPLAELQRLVATLGQAERLSSTFRFDDGSIDLDAQSRASVARLAAAIERGAFDGRRLVFVGFSDGEGQAELNLRLSLRRAETVRNAIQAAAEAAEPDRVTLDIDAFGEAMPMACEDSDWGRAVNRRVEVWLE
ncbi:phosphate ABC transporter substrate-binding/OmpA family protein [Roseicyclus mahoneyensis]|nr:phosphate ABC transporter substrate-binding/OmpA family protein [Roseicyclus mahoneyensis]